MTDEEYYFSREKALREIHTIVECEYRGRQRKGWVERIEEVKPGKFLLSIKFSTMVPPPIVESVSKKYYGRMRKIGQLSEEPRWLTSQSVSNSIHLFTC